MRQRKKSLKAFLARFDRGNKKIVHSERPCKCNNLSCCYPLVNRTFIVCCISKYHFKIYKEAKCYFNNYQKGNYEYFFPFDNLHFQYFQRKLYIAKLSYRRLVQLRTDFLYQCDTHPPTPTTNPDNYDYKVQAGKFSLFAPPLYFQLR